MLRKAGLRRRPAQGTIVTSRLSGVVVIAALALVSAAQAQSPQTPTLPTGCPDLPAIPPTRLSPEHSPIPVDTQIQFAKTLKQVCSYNAGQVAQVLRSYAFSHPTAEIPDVLKGAGFDANQIAEALRIILVEPKLAVQALKRLAFARADVVSAVVRGYQLAPADQLIVLSAKQRDENVVHVQGYRPETFAKDLAGLQPGSAADRLQFMAGAFRLANAQAASNLVDSFSSAVVLQSLVNVALPQSVTTSAKRRSKSSSRRRRSRKERRRTRSSRALRQADALQTALPQVVRALEVDGRSASDVLAMLSEGYTNSTLQPVSRDISLPLIIPSDEVPDAGLPVPKQPVAAAIRLVSDAGYPRDQIATALIGTYVRTTPTAFTEVARLFRDVLKDTPCKSAQLLDTAFGRSSAQVAGALQALHDSATVTAGALKCAVVAKSGQATAALTSGTGKSIAPSEGLATYPLVQIPAAMADVFDRKTPMEVYADLRAAGFTTPSATAESLALTTTGKERPARLTQLMRTYRDAWKPLSPFPAGDPLASRVPSFFLMNPLQFAMDVANALQKVKVLDAAPRANEMAKAFLDADQPLVTSAEAIRQAFRLTPHATFMAFRPLIDLGSQVKLAFALAGAGEAFKTTTLALPPPAKSLTIKVPRFGADDLAGPTGKRVVSVLVGEPAFAKADAVKLIAFAFAVSPFTAARAYERVRQNRSDVSASDLVDSYLAAFPGTSLVTVARDLRADYRASEILSTLLPRLRKLLNLPERPAVGDTRPLLAATGLMTNAGFPADQALQTVKAVAPGVVPTSATDVLKAFAVTHILAAPGVSKIVGIPGVPPLYAPTDLLKSPLDQLTGLKALGYDQCVNVTAVTNGLDATHPNVSRVVGNYEQVFGSLSKNGLSFLSDCYRKANIVVPVPLRLITVTVTSVQLGPSTVQIDHGMLVGRLGLRWQGLDVARGLPDNLAKIPLFATNDDITQGPSTPKTVDTQAVSRNGNDVLPNPRVIVLPDIPRGSAFPAPELTVDVVYYSRPGGYCVFPSETDPRYKSAAVFLGKDEYFALPSKSRLSNTQHWHPTDDVVAANSSSATFDVSGDKPVTKTTSMGHFNTCGSIRSGEFSFTTTVTSKHFEPASISQSPESLFPGSGWSGKYQRPDRAESPDLSGDSLLQNQLRDVYPDLFAWMAANNWSGTPKDVSALAKLLLGGN